MDRKEDGLQALGAKTTYRMDYAPEVLETFVNKHPGNDYWASVIPVTRRFSIIPSIYGRILIGRDFPYPLQNAIGGDVPGFYIPQQLPFAGVTNLELMDNTIMIASIYKDEYAERGYRPELLSRSTSSGRL